MSWLKTALAIARKDLRLYFRDRTGVALGFLLPLVLVGVFGFLNRFMVGGGGSAFSRATVWVADEDATEASRAFVAALRRSSTLRVRPEGEDDPVDAAALRRKIADGELHHALIVERGFGDSLTKGELPKLRMLRDPDRTVEQQLIAVGLMQAVFTSLGPDFATPLTTRALELAGVPVEWRERTLALSRTFTSGVEALFREKEASDAPAETAPPTAAEPGDAPAGEDADGFDLATVMTRLLPMEQEDFRPPKRPKQLTYMVAHTVSGMGVMMLMFGLVACAGLLIAEREEGTLRRLLLSPGDRSAILGGKFLFTAAIGAMQLAVLFAFGAVVFDLDVTRDPATFLVVTFTLLVAVTAFGMLIGAWARTSKQADGVSTLLILVMSALGGAWFPLQMLDLGTPVKVVMGCTLTHWAVSAYHGLFWYGLSFTHGRMLLSLGVLWGFAIVATLLARRFFERRYVDV